MTNIEKLRSYYDTLTEKQKVKLLISIFRALIGVSQVSPQDFSQDETLLEMFGAINEIQHQICNILGALLNEKSITRKHEGNLNIEHLWTFRGSVQYLEDALEDLLKDNSGLCENPTQLISGV